MERLAPEVQVQDVQHRGVWLQPIAAKKKASLQRFFGRMRLFV